MLLVTWGKSASSNAPWQPRPASNSSAADDLVEGLGRLDVTAPTMLPAVHSLATPGHPFGQSPTGSKSPGWPRPRPLGLAHDASPARFVNLDNVQLAETLTVKPPTWAVPRRSVVPPLILAGEAGRQRLIWIVGSTPSKTTWPRASVPIFIKLNAVAWPDPSATKAGQFQVRAVRSHPPHPRRIKLTNATVRLPDGSERAPPTLSANWRSQTAPRDLSPGRGQPSVVSANLFDAAETDTTPKPELGVRQVRAD